MQRRVQGTNFSDTAPLLGLAKTAKAAAVRSKPSSGWCSSFSWGYLVVGATVLTVAVVAAVALGLAVSANNRVFPTAFDWSPYFQFDGAPEGTVLVVGSGSGAAGQSSDRAKHPRSTSSSTTAAGGVTGNDPWSSSSSAVDTSQLRPIVPASGLQWNTTTNTLNIETISLSRLVLNGTIISLGANGTATAGGNVIGPSLGSVADSIVRWRSSNGIDITDSSVLITDNGDIAGSRFVNASLGVFVGGVARGDTFAVTTPGSHNLGALAAFGADGKTVTYSGITFTNATLTVPGAINITQLVVNGTELSALLAAAAAAAATPTNVTLVREIVQAAVANITFPPPDETNVTLVLQLIQDALAVFNASLPQPGSATTNVTLVQQIVNAAIANITFPPSVNGTNVTLVLQLVNAAIANITFPPPDETNATLVQELVDAAIAAIVYPPSVTNVTLVQQIVQAAIANITFPPPPTFETNVTLVLQLIQDAIATFNASLPPPPAPGSGTNVTLVQQLIADAIAGITFPTYTNVTLVQQLINAAIANITFPPPDETNVTLVLELINAAIANITFPPPDETNVTLVNELIQSALNNFSRPLNTSLVQSIIDAAIANITFPPPDETNVTLVLELINAAIANITFPPDETNVTLVTELVTQAIDQFKLTLNTSIVTDLIDAAIANITFPPSVTNVTLVQQLIDAAIAEASADLGTNVTLVNLLISNAVNNITFPDTTNTTLVGQLIAAAIGNITFPPDETNVTLVQQLILAAIANITFPPPDETNVTLVQELIVQAVTSIQFPDTTNATTVNSLIQSALAAANVSRLVRSPATSPAPNTTTDFRPVPFFSDGTGSELAFSGDLRWFIPTRRLYALNIESTGGTIATLSCTALTAATSINTDTLVASSTVTAASVLANLLQSSATDLQLVCLAAGAIRFTTGPIETMRINSTAAVFAVPVVSQAGADLVLHAQNTFIRFLTLGVERVTLSATALQVTVPIASATATDLLLQSPSAAIALSTGGTERVRISALGAAFSIPITSAAGSSLTVSAVVNLLATAGGDVLVNAGGATGLLTLQTNSVTRVDVTTTSAIFSVPVTSPPATDLTVRAAGSNLILGTSSVERARVTDTVFQVSVPVQSAAATDLILNSVNTAIIFRIAGTQRARVLATGFEVSVAITTPASTDLSLIPAGANINVNSKTLTNVAILSGGSTTSTVGTPKWIVRANGANRYGIGAQTSALSFEVPQTTDAFSWYFGTTERMRLSNTALNLNTASITTSTGQDLVVAPAGPNINFSSKTALNLLSLTESITVSATGWTSTSTRIRVSLIGNQVVLRVTGVFTLQTPGPATIAPTPAFSAAYRPQVGVICFIWNQGGEQLLMFVQTGGTIVIQKTNGAAFSSGYVATFSEGTPCTYDTHPL